MSEFVPSDPSSEASRYRFSPVFALRLIGGLFIVLALVVLVLVVVLVALDADVAWALGAGLAGLVAVLGLAVLGTRVAIVVRLDDQGYVVRFIRGAGVKRARWSDLADVSTGATGSSPVLLFRLRDGRTTTVPVEVLAGSADDFVQDVRDRARRHMTRGKRR